LEIGLLIDTQDEFARGDGARVQVNQSKHELGKVFVARHFRGEPKMMSPGFEYVGTQDAPDGFRLLLHLSPTTLPLNAMHLKSGFKALP
jgi:hypothetical protein